jgi:hypothetical protein
MKTLTPGKLPGEGVATVHAQQIITCPRCSCRFEIEPGDEVVFRFDHGDEWHEVQCPTPGCSVVKISMDY